MTHEVELRTRTNQSQTVSGRRRVVLFGASNLTLALPLVVAELQRSGSGPIELYSVHGHGRSYGLASRVLARELPGILECGVWRALAGSQPGRTDALLTDIGNDILYGADVATIAGWIEECLGRLSAHGARVAIARLPLASLERLSRWRFELVRALFFPTRFIAFEVARERARELDARLLELARTHGASSIEPASGWYGLDPIHIRRSVRAEAWRALLSGWDRVAMPLGPIGRMRPTRSLHLGLRDRIALARSHQEARRIFGFTQNSRQPAAVFADGTTIALY